MSRICILGFATSVSERSGRSDSIAHWAILVEPKKQGRLFHHKRPSAVVFESANGELRRKSVAQGSFDDELLVKILVGIAGNGSTTRKIGELLRQISASTSDLWLGASLSVLQSAGLIERISIEHVRAIAKEALEKQQIEDRHEPIAVDYLAQLERNADVKEMLSREPQSDKVKKLSNRGFGFSTPRVVARPARKVYSFERQDDPYAGLM